MFSLPSGSSVDLPARWSRDTSDSEQARTLNPTPACPGGSPPIHKKDLPVKQTTRHGEDLQARTTTDIPIRDRHPPGEQPSPGWGITPTTSSAKRGIKPSSTSTRYFDEFRARKKKTIELFAGNGVALAAAKKLFQLPDTVVEGPETISKGRKPLPPIDEMLLLMGAPYPEPGWLPVAYSLLSQVTHSTPIGLVHMARYSDGVLHAHAVSPEMLALALDVACLGSARLISLSALMLTHGDDAARQYALGLEERALAVHDIARRVHWLD